MSAYLRSRLFWLGRNAMILAAQPLDRLAEKAALPSTSLLWRAVLQIIFRDVAPLLSHRDKQVGRLAAKSENFIDYVRKALKKAGVTSELSDEAIQSYLDKYGAEYGGKLNRFYQFRALFAPVVEAVILLDRVLFVLEQGQAKAAGLYKLFDAVTSPRCYALVATKL